MQNLPLTFDYSTYSQKIPFFAGRYDGFDCSSEIPEACSIDLLKNGVCDEETNTTLCAGDLGSCEPNLLGNFRFCLENPKLSGDGLCDMLNNMKECGFDNDDCITNQGILVQLHTVWTVNGVLLIPLYCRYLL